MPAYPEDIPPAPYPEVTAAPAYPGESPPAYPAPALPEPPEETAPAYPGEAFAPPRPGASVPAPRAEQASAEALADAYEPPADPHPAAAAPAPPAEPPAAGGFGPVVDHDDLALDQGRRMVKAVQRRIDGAALSHLLLTVPIGLISLAVVAFLSTLIPVVGLIVPVAWLLSGPLVFNRKVESAIAQRLFGMRRPTPEEARRLDLVWEQVTRRAGVNRETYELWIQERTELNATAAAGHIVAVTRHAMERLPNSRLGSVLAHELGHHVGGHAWAAMLADWYALPARVAGRAILAFLLLLFRTKHWAGIACGGCLSLTIVQFLFVMTFMEGMWWLVIPVAAGPLLVAWLHRRAEFRADAYAVGLGFGEALEDVLMSEARAAAVPGAPPQGPAPAPAPVPAAPAPLGAPPVPGQYPPQQYPGQPEGGGRLVAKAAHTNAEARLRNVRLVMSQQLHR
ncbi:M48 family metalloprotease [Streptomyces sp. NPDC090445]|uniref:M48 family metalloprotease n=1 Tax=Streptomyces sp. NPDC090445 TaxID=3365963 RepID=UPI0038148432